LRSDCETASRAAGAPTLAVSQSLRNPLGALMEHLEGRQSVLAALEARQRRFQVILVSHGAHVEKIQELLDKAAALNVPVRQVDRKELDALAHGATHGGVIAVVSPKPRLTPAQLLELVDGLKEPALLLLIEGIEDARNLGFVIRTAEATGVHAVLVKKHLWDLDPVEIARPASGAYERMPLAQIEDVAPLKDLQRRGLRLLGCIAGAKRSLYATDLTTPAVLCVGGEKRGLSGAVRSICDAFLTIPQRPGASSLSLSHASAILMGEAMRQRLGGKQFTTENTEEDTETTEDDAEEGGE
jgi:23S rRNA (guanosine2251-2'-O)-methyltransferase